MPKIKRVHKDASAYASSFCSSNPIAEKLKLKKNIPTDFSQFHHDFLCVYVFVMFRYIRNMFRKDSTFSKEDFYFSDFNYDYANEHNTGTRLLEMQKKLTEFNSLLDKSSFFVEDYKRFVKDSMNELIEVLIVPISTSNIFPEIQEIIQKYKKKKPPKFNIEIARQLLGEL